MAYNSSYTALTNLFSALEDASTLIKALVPISVTIQLEKTDYQPGEVVRGTVTIAHQHRLQLYGVLAVLNGTIKSNVKIRTRKWTDSVSNLHVFTFLAKSGRPDQDVVLAASPRGAMYSFSLPLPETNLPASYDSPNGTIKYRVQVVIGSSNIYKVIGEQEFTLAPYFNLNIFTSSKMLAKESWQTMDGIFVKERLKFDIIGVNLRGKLTSGGGVTMTKAEDGSSGSMFSSLLHSKKAKLEVTLTIPSISFCIGDKIPFRVLIENPNGDRVTKIDAGIITRTIYTAMRSKIVMDDRGHVTNVPEQGTSTPLEWNGSIQIPADLTITSSLVTTTVNQPIIFQYILIVVVHRDGKEPFQVETLICVGTTADAMPKPRQRIVHLETCKYPLGHTEMSYPEDWDQMYKTGRFGYVPNAKVVIGEGVGSRSQPMNRAMSVLSLSKPPPAATPTSQLAGLSLEHARARGCTRSRSGSLSVASLTSSQPPAYSGLSSRRSSCLSLPPPAYSQIVEEKGANDEERNADAE